MTGEEACADINPYPDAPLTPGTGPNLVNDPTIEWVKDNFWIIGAVCGLCASTSILWCLWTKMKKCRLQRAIIDANENRFRCDDLLVTQLVALGYTEMQIMAAKHSVDGPLQLNEAIDIIGLQEAQSNSLIAAISNGESPNYY